VNSSDGPNVDRQVDLRVVFHTHSRERVSGLTATWLSIRIVNQTTAQLSFGSFFLRVTIGQGEAHTDSALPDLVGRCVAGAGKTCIGTQ